MGLVLYWQNDMSAFSGYCVIANNFVQALIRALDKVEQQFVDTFLLIIFGKSLNIEQEHLAGLHFTYFGYVIRGFNTFADLNDRLHFKDLPIVF